MGAAILCNSWNCSLAPIQIRIVWEINHHIYAHSPIIVREKMWMHLHCVLFLARWYVCLCFLSCACLWFRCTDDDASGAADARRLCCHGLRQVCSSGVVSCTSICVHVCICLCLFLCAAREGGRLKAAMANMFSTNTLSLTQAQT